MSKTIDERVVSMQFDNQQFEHNVRTSLSTIEKLKQSLNFKSASQGLENINKAAKSCNLAPLSNAVETVKIKFSAMEVMAVTALSNITNSAVNAGKRIVKSLTIDPVKTGLSEYETQIGAIQTILANTESKGSTLEDVNAALDELNTYADKTIYNFTQMTRNIGTFTAAGVGLEESTQAIKGIANLAAVSGSTSQQASTAMYQLSQALAAGKVSLMDWNSVVNAGMGGEVFQNALKRTSRMLGTGVDEAIKKYGTFRESLTQGQWLTKEVLVETLAQLSGAYTEAELIQQGFTQQQAAEIAKLAKTAEDAATKVKTFTQLFDTLKESAQSGWTQTWEYIFGDFEESKWFFSNLSDSLGAFIGKSADSRNKLLGEAMTSNYDKLIGKLKDAGIEATDFESKLRDVLKKHSFDVDYLTKTYGSLERAITHEAIPVDMLRIAIDDLGVAAEVSLEGIDRLLKRGTSGDDVKKAQKALKALGYDIGTFGEQADGIDGIIGNMTESAIRAFQEKNGLKVDGIIGEETLAALEKASKNTKVLGEDIYSLIDGVDKLGGGELLREGITNIVKSVLNIFSSVKSAWGDIFSIKPEQIYNALDGFHKFSEKLLKWTEDNSDKIKAVFKGVFSVFGIAWDALRAVLAGIWKVAKPIFSAIGKGLFTAISGIGEWLSGLRDSIKESGKFAKITETVADVISKVINYIKAIGKPIWEWIFGSENDAEGQLTGLQQFIEKVKTFIAESKAIAYVGEKIGNAFKRIREYFTNLFPSAEEIAENGFDIGGILTKIKDDIINFFKNFSVKDLFAKIGNFFKEFGANFSADFLSIGIDFESIKANIIDKFVTVRDSVINFFKNFDFKEAMVWLKTNIAKILPAIGSFFMSIAEKIAAMFGVSKEKFEEIRKKISDFFSGIAEWFGDNKGSIAALGALVGMIALLIKIKKFLSGVFGVFDGISEAISGFIESYSALNKAKAKKLNSEAIRNVAIAIGILATSLLIISKVPKDDMLRASITLGVMIGVVVGIMILMNKLNSSVSFKASATLFSFGSMMAGLGAALLLMTFAIKIIGGMDPGELMQGGLAVTAFLGITMLLMKASKSIGDGKINQFGKMIKKLGWALLLLSASVYIFGKMDTNTLIRGGLAVTYFLGIMAGVMAIAGLLEGDVKSFGKMIRSLSVSLLMLSAVVYILGSMDTKTLIKGGLAVTVFLGIIIGLMAATKLMGKYSYNAGKMGLMILSFSASLLLMAAAVAALSMIEGKDLVKAEIAMAGIGAIFAGMMVLTKFAKNIKVGTIIGLSLAIAIMAGSVAALSFIEKDKLINATACLSILTGMFAALMVASKFASFKSLGSLAGMIILIGGIGILFGALANKFEDAENAVKVATAVGILVSALSASVLILSKVKYSNTSSKGMATALIAFGVLAAIVGIFATIAIASLPKIADKLSDFMTKLKPFIDGMRLIDRGMVERIKILGEAMSAFAGAGAKFAIANMFTLGGVSIAFESFIHFIKQVIPVIKDAAIETSGIDIDFTNLDGIIDAIVGLAEAADLVPMNTIAGFGSKWGGGGIISWNALGSFTEFVVQAIPIVQNFAIAIKDADIDSKSVSLVSDLFKAIGYLADAADKAPGIEAAGGLAKFKGGFAGGGYVTVPQLTEFTTYVKEILSAVEKFIPALTGTAPTVDISYITGIFDCVKKLGEAAGDAPTVSAGVGFAKFGKLWGIFGGGTWTDMESFRKYLVGDETTNGAIDAVKEFINGIDYDKFSGIEPEAIEPIMTGISNVISAISTLASAAKNAPTTTIGGGIGAAFSKIYKAVGFGASGYYSTTDIDKFKEYLTGDNGAIAAVRSFLTDDEIRAAVDEFSDYKPETIDAIMGGISSIVGAISTLASSADSAPKKVDAGGIGAFFSKFGVVGAGAGEYHSTQDLDKFKTWLIGEDGKSGMLSAVSGFIDVINDDDTLTAIKNINDNHEGFNLLIGAVESIAKLADVGPTKLDAAGGFAGVFGKLTGALGIAGVAAGGGEIKMVTDLNDLTKWMTEITPVLENFIVDVSGIEISDQTALETILGAVDSIATAANNVKPKTDGWGAGLAIISGIPVIAAGGGGSATDYDGFISFMNELGGENGPIVSILEAVKNLSFDGSIDSDDTNKMTAFLSAVDALAASAKNIPEYDEFELLFGVLGTYKEAPDFDGFANWINTMTGEDGKGGIVKLITDANDFLPEELDANKISNLCYVVKQMAEAADAIPDTSAWGEIFSGVTDFEGFSNFVDTIGTEVVNFATTVKDSTIEDVDLSKILSMAEVLKSLSAVANELYTYAGSDFETIKSFGTADDTGKTPIGYLVEAVTGTEESLSKLDESDVATLEVVGKTLEALITALNSIVGATSSIEIFTEDNYKMFADYAKGIATMLSEFTTEMEGVNLDRLSIASTAVDLISGAFVNLQSLEYGKINTALLKTKLDELATAMSEFSVDFETENVNDAITKLSTLTTDLSTALSKDFSGADELKTTLANLGTVSLDKFVEAMSDQTKLTGIGPNLLIDVVSGLTMSISKFSTTLQALGSSVMSILASGIASGTDSINSACSYVIRSALNVMFGYKEFFTKSGSNMAIGFANGIKDSSWYVKRVARAMARAALTSVNEALDENSPSKEAYKSGVFFGEGFVNGIDDYSIASSKAGEGIATAAKNGLSNAISKVKELIENGVDNQPTIRPVLDLSEIEAGANGIGDMFGINPSVVLRSKVGSINSTMNNRQNGNTDLLSAIKDLGRTMSKPSGDTYNFGAITYDDGSNIAGAVKTLTRAAKIERRR